MIKQIHQQPSTSTQPTRQKQQALLITSYRQAIALLHQPSTRQEGKYKLLSILANPDCQQQHLRQLRLSTLLSLAELYRLQGNKIQALTYWYQSTNIQDSFNVWVKMAQTLQALRSEYLKYNKEQKSKLNIGQLQLEQQIEHAYKKSIELSPPQWRGQLLETLHKVYIEHNKTLQASDLHKIIRENLYELVTAKDTASNKEMMNEQNSTQQMNQSIDKEGQRIQKLDQIRVPLYFLQSNDSVCLWDYLFSFSYLMLTLNNAAKKISKKHEDIISKISKFSITDTKIVFDIQKPFLSDKVNFSQPNQQQQCQISNGNHKDALYLLEDQIEQKQNQLNHPIPNIPTQPSPLQFAQKLHNLIIDTLKELCRDKQHGSAIQKSKKNQLPTSTSSTSNSKAIFQNIYEYFKQTLIAKGIDVQMLNAFKYVDLHYNQTLQSVLSVHANDEQHQSIPHKPFETIIEPIIMGVKSAVQKEQQQQSLEQEGLGPRERRSTSFGNSIVTPTPNRKTQQSKYQQLMLNKLKQNFQQQILLSKQFQFSNILHLTDTQINQFVRFLMANKINMLTEQQSEVSSSILLKNTSKIIFLLIIKMCQISAFSTFDVNNWKLEIKVCITLGSLILKGFDQELYGGVAGISVSIRQIWESLSRFCINTLDKLIYSKTISNTKYSNEELTSILELLNLSILVHSTPNFVHQNRLTQLCNYYQNFSTLLNNYNESQILASDAATSQLVLKSMQNIWVPLSSNNMLEVVTARKRKCKLKQLSQQQCEKSSLMSSIDNLFKSDMKSSQIVESVKSILSNKNSSLVLCLRSFGRVVQNLFQNIEQITGGFGVKYIQNSLKCMEIPSLIQCLHSKLTQEKKGDRGKQETEDQKKVISLYQVKEQYLFKLDTLFNLIKIYLLQELDQHISSVCLRIVFYLLEDAFRSMAEFQKQVHEKEMKSEIQQIETESNSSICLHYYNRNQICRIIVLIDTLIKAKQSVELRKKFYHRVLIKNIPFIYNLYSHQKLDEPELQNQVYRILSQAFHSKNFKAKKIQDCNGYFLMISRQFSSEFDQQVVEFQQKMKRVCNQCYLIFKDQFEQHFPICSRFKKAMELFVFVMRKKFKQSQQLIDFFTSKQIICECCQAPYLKNELNKQSFAKETIFAVAKYLQNKKNGEKGPIQNQNKEVSNEQQNSGEKEDKGIKKSQSYIELEDEIQNYYLKYFLLAINTGKAWLHMLRFQVSKVYQYFDALMGIQTAQTIIADTPTQTTPNPDSILQCYKHKFKYAKSIASFIIKNFSTQQYEQAREYAIYRVHLINTLKIQQRKLNYRLSVLEKNSQLIKSNYNKYMQGILAIISQQKQTEENQIDLTNCYPQVLYLLYVQYKLPFLVYKLENQLDLQANSRFLQSVLKQGLLLIQQLTAHQSRSAQQHSEQSGINKCRYSRYQVSHLKDSLKVQICMTLSDLILNNLQYIKMEADLMQRQIQRCSAPTNANTKKYYRDKLQPQKQQKLIEKLQKLSLISKVLSSFESEIQSWKNQELAEQLSCQKKPTKLQFRTKYQFPQYIQLLTSLQKNLFRIVQVLHSYSIQNPLKPRRQNYSRSIFLCNLYCSTIFHQLNSRDQCLTYIKQISNGKNEEIINFYHHYEKKPTEENNILAQFYCRDIVYHGVKIKAIQHKLEVYAGKMETLQIGLALIRKLGKLAVCKIQTEKDKAKDKIQENGDGKIKEGQNKQEIKKQGSKLKGNEEVKEEQGEKGRQKKKGKKQGKQGKDPKNKQEKGNKIQKRIKWMYLLQLRGIEIFLDTVINSSNTKNEPVDEKFEKALLQFKNKLKRQNEKEKKKTNDQNQLTKSYGSRLASDLQNFIQHYQQKYTKKLRLKASKKPKQQPTIQANTQTKNNLDIGPQIQNTMLIKKTHEKQVKQKNELEHQFVYQIKQEEQVDHEILNDNDNDNQDSEDDNNQVDGQYQFREYEGEAVKREEGGEDGWMMMDQGRQYRKSQVRFNYGLDKNQMNDGKMQLDQENQEINQDYGERILQEQNQWDEDSDNP